MKRTVNRNEISRPRAFMSVFELAVRRALPTAAAAALVFSLISFFAALAAARWGASEAPEALFSVSRARLTAFIGLALLSLALCGVSSGRTREEYLLHRLSLGEAGITAARWLAGAVMLAVYWALLALAALAACLAARDLRPDGFTVQTIFLGFYRSEYLHNLLPLCDAAALVRNAVMLLSLAAVCACAAGRCGKSRVPASLVIMLALFFAAFRTELYEATPAILETLAAPAVAGFSVYAYFTADGGGEDGGETDEEAFA